MAKVVDLNWPENHAIRRDGRSVNLATNQADLPLTAISSFIKGQLWERRKVVDSRKDSISDSRVLTDFNRRQIARERRVFLSAAPFHSRSSRFHPGDSRHWRLPCFLSYCSFLNLDLYQGIELIKICISFSSIQLSSMSIHFSHLSTLYFQAMSN